MQVQDIINQANAIIKKNLPKTYKIFLFGSWAKGNALETSDIDIGILGEEKVTWDCMHRILSEIEQIPMLRSIDIVDLNSTSEDFRKTVLKTSKTLA